MKRSNYEKGEDFAWKVADMITSFIPGRYDVRPSPRSGAISSWKGDLTFLPKQLSQYVVECKDCKTIKIGDWWKQVVDEAIKSSKDPMLVLSLGDEILVVKRLKDNLKEVKK
jgi:hypothetical protein